MPTFLIIISARLFLLHGFVGVLFFCLSLFPICCWVPYLKRSIYACTKEFKKALFKLLACTIQQFVRTHLEDYLMGLHIRCGRNGCHTKHEHMMFQLYARQELLFTAAMLILLNSCSLSEPLEHLFWISNLWKRHFFGICRPSFLMFETFTFVFFTCSFLHVIFFQFLIFKELTYDWTSEFFMQRCDHLLELGFLIGRLVSTRFVKRLLVQWNWLLIQ